MSDRILAARAHAVPDRSAGARFDVKHLDFADRTLSIAGFPGDPYFESIEQQLRHCHLLSAVLFHHLNPSATIVDVGANLGLTTVLAHLLVEDARILSLEPSRVYDCLVETVALNRIARQRSLRLCVGEIDGETLFVEALDSSASHRVLDGKRGVAVPVRRLDTIVAKCGFDRVDFVKIDVEGFEQQVLNGMTEVIERHAPLVLMEFNAFTLTAYGNCSPRGLLDRIVATFGGFIADVGGLRYYRTEDDILTFLAGNMLARGCVDDIIFSSSPERIAAFGLG